MKMSEDGPDNSLLGDDVLADKRVYPGATAADHTREHGVDGGAEPWVGSNNSARLQWVHVGWRGLRSRGEV